MERDSQVTDLVEYCLPPTVEVVIRCRQDQPTDQLPLCSHYLSLALMNGQDVKILKIDSAFIFHAHPNRCEMFYILSGKRTMAVEGGAKSVRRRPVAQNAHITMERAGRVNAGDQEDSKRRQTVKDFTPAA